MDSPLAEGALMEQLPTIVLTERTAVECCLGPDDVDYLLSEHRAHLELVPTRQTGRYRLTPAGYVGTIAAPGCRLVIRPKLPLRNLFHLLDPNAPVPLGTDRASVLPGAEALEFLAGRLAQLLAERAAAGLQRGYTERAEVGAYLQGRLDVPAQLRAPSSRRDRLHCRHEDFSADLPCNQVPKATAELLLQSPLLGDEGRAALQRGLQGWSRVSSVLPGPESFTTPTEAYRPLLDLCRLLLDGLRPGESAGPVRCPAFLLDMEDVFERYVTDGIRRTCADSPLRMAAQPLIAVNEPLPRHPDLHIRPDILLLNEEEPLLVIDAKWKRLRCSPLVRADVYQMLAYCAGLGVRRAVLVYPGRRDRLWKYALTRSPVTVEVRTLRVAGSRRACRLSMRRLGQAVAALIGGG
jgi:5-methylcytosine-specific restriction enzyme subunit McrC